MHHNFGASSLDFAFKIAPIIEFCNAVNHVGEENLGELQDLSLIKASGPSSAVRNDLIVYQNRCITRGVVRFTSDFLLFHIDPAAQAMSPKELLKNPGLYEMSQEDNKIVNEAMAFCLSDGASLPSNYRDKDSKASNQAHLKMAHNLATKWRLKEKEIAEKLLRYPAELDYEIAEEYYQELQKKIEIPKDPFNMTQEEIAKWSDQSVNMAIQTARQGGERGYILLHPAGGPRSLLLFGRRCVGSPLGQPHLTRSG